LLEVNARLSSVVISFDVVDHLHMTKNCQRVNQADLDLDLITQLEVIRMNIARAFVWLEFTQSDAQYSAVFLQAGLGSIDDDSETVASRICEAIRINRNAANLNHELGRNLEALDQHSEALAEHRHAVTLEPTNLSC
jgi:hypothetical protein